MARASRYWARRRPGRGFPPPRTSALVDRPLSSLVGYHPRVSEGEGQRAPWPEHPLLPNVIVRLARTVRLSEEDN